MSLGAWGQVQFECGGGCSLGACTPKRRRVINRHALLSRNARIPNAPGLDIAYLHLLLPHAQQQPPHTGSRTSLTWPQSAPLPLPMFLSTNRRLPLYKALSLQQLASVQR
jgi:hypothetical protein